SAAAGPDVAPRVCAVQAANQRPQDAAQAAHVRPLSSHGGGQPDRCSHTCRSLTPAPAPGTRYLTTYDCVTFLNMLDTILAGFHALGDHSTWVLADAANTLVRAAQARVYRKKPNVAEGQRLTAAS